MRIAFIQAHHPYGQFTHVHPLGLMMIASSARAAGFGDLHLIDMKVERLGTDDAVERLEALQPDWVGISAMTYEAGSLAEVAAAVKERWPKTRVVAGGPHPSVAPEDVLEQTQVDYVIRGEGEATFPALVEAVEGGADLEGVPGIAWRNGKITVNEDRPPPSDLDALPWPAWDMVPMERYHTVPRGGIIYREERFATMFSSRACPWRCTYCHNSYGKQFRERSPDDVLGEIDMLVADHGVRELVFMDDIFNFKPARAEAIADGLIERGHNLALTFPNGFRGDILTPDLVDKLKAAGMYRCMVAVESSVRRIQKVCQKNLNVDKVDKIVRHIADRGVLVHGAFMLGFPTETEEEMRETVRWARNSAFHTAAFFRVIPFKGTTLFSQVEEAGHPLPTDWAAYEPYETDINLSEVSEEKIAHLRKWAYRSFYFRPSRLWRLLRLLPRKSRLIQTLAGLFLKRAYAR